MDCGVHDLNGLAELVVGDAGVGVVVTSEIVDAASAFAMTVAGFPAGIFEKFRTGLTHCAVTELFAENLFFNGIVARRTQESGLVGVGLLHEVVAVGLAIAL